MMEKQIDKLISLHEDSVKREKYMLVCDIEEFKNLQILMRDKYKIKDYQNNNSMWRHVIDEDKSSYREGTVKFKNFTLNVYCSTKIVGGFVISKMNGLPIAYMNIFKNDK